MTYKSHNKKRKKGFTLIEALVVIAITTIISGIMVVGFRQGAEKSQLQRSAQIVIQGLRKAQNMSLSSFAYQGQVYNYYGAYFNKQSMSRQFYIFVSANKVYNSGEQIETIILESKIIIDSISTGTSLDITFLPPYALVDFNPSVENVTITIKKEGGICPSDCRYIKINDKGWMSIKTNP